jgi:hypothetical protein
MTAPLTIDVPVRVDRTPVGLELEAGGRRVAVSRERLVAELLARRPQLSDAEAERTVDRFLAGAEP